MVLSYGDHMTSQNNNLIDRLGAVYILIIISMVIILTPKLIDVIWVISRQNHKTSSNSDYAN